MIQLSPNPISPQLFLINKKFAFEFNTKGDLLITIKSICGEAKVKWQTDEGIEYSLTGKDKMLSLTSTLRNKSDYEKILSNLDIYSIQEENNCPGFAFLINYLLRPTEINLDEIHLGKSTRMAYRDTDFPLYIYSDIAYLDKDIHASFNLYELIGEMESGLQKIEPFKISAALVCYNTIMNAKLDKNILEGLNFEYKGIYDPMIKTGFVLITKKDIKNKNFEKKDSPCIILKIIKNKNYPKMENTNFTRITLEASIIQDNTGIPIIPGIYQPGKLSLSSDKNIYKLKSNKAKKYMRIQLSLGSNKIKYVIGVTPNDTSSFSFQEYEDKKQNGKQIITFDSNPYKYSYIYLIIYHQSNKASTDQVTNYIFKYMTSSNKNGFIEYKLESDRGFELNKKQEGRTYTYTFKITPLPYDHVNLAYFIKYTPKNDYIEGENDNCTALRESKSWIEELTNFEIEDSKIFKEYKIKEIDYRYVQVITMVNWKDNYKFVGYGSYFEEDINDEDSIFVWWKILLIAFGVVFAITIIIIIIIIYLRKKRNFGQQMEGLEDNFINRFTDNNEY